MYACAKESRLAARLELAAAIGEVAVPKAAVRATATVRERAERVM